MIYWVRQHFHQDDFCCPTCQASLNEAREYRETNESNLTTYRCGQCDTTYNLYTGTLFEQCHFTPEQVVMLLRGIFQGVTSRQLADELDVDYTPVLKWRHRVREQVEAYLSDEPLSDEVVESDEFFQTAGEKRETSSKSSGSTAN